MSEEQKKKKKDMRPPDRKELYSTPQNVFYVGNIGNGLNSSYQVVY